MAITTSSYDPLSSQEVLHSPSTPQLLEQWKVLLQQAAIKPYNLDAFRLQKEDSVQHKQAQPSGDNRQSPNPVEVLSWLATAIGALRLLRNGKGQQHTPSTTELKPAPLINRAVGLLWRTLTPFGKN